MAMHWTVASSFAQPLPTDARRRVRTLVVDNSLTFVELLCALTEIDSMLEIVGRAKDGAEAIAAVAELEPDLVLMNVHMSGMSGLTASMLISENFPETAVVLMADDDSRQLSAECRACGADRLVYKPNLIRELSAELRGILAARQQ